MQEKRGGFVPLFKITEKAKKILEFAKKNKTDKINKKENTNDIMQLL